MARIELCVSLDITAPCKPEVRAWLDLDPHQGLSSEIELALVQSARGLWRGHFRVDERRCEHFAYRIGVVAHVEAEWSLRLRHCELDSDLLVDSDRLMLTKCWLIGNCNVRRGDDRFTPTESAQTQSARRLVLLPGGGGKRVVPRGVERSGGNP